MAALGPWMTVPETVKYLGLPSDKALYQAVRRGQIPAHRLGKRLRFSAVELDRVLEENLTLTIPGRNATSYARRPLADAGKEA